MRSCLDDYEVVAAESLQAALELLSAKGGWRPLAGGTDLMVLLNAGKLPFRRLVSLRNLDELRQITVSETHVTIGAAVTYAKIQLHPVLDREFPLLCQAARWTGGVANQNQGTLGGNIANGSPAADSAPPLLVHDATIQLVSTLGSRRVPYSEFHLGYKSFAMRADELIYAIELPRRAQTWRYQGRKVGTRRAQAISKVSFGAGAHLDGEQIVDIRFGFASVAPIPLRCVATERFLIGKSIKHDAIMDSVEVLRSELRPISDIRSTHSYRSHVSENLLKDFLENLG